MKEIHFYKLQLKCEIIKVNSKTLLQIQHITVTAMSSIK